MTNLHVSIIYTDYSPAHFIIVSAYVERQNAWHSSASTTILLPSIVPLAPVKIKKKTSQKYYHYNKR